VTANVTTTEGTPMRHLLTATALLIAAALPALAAPGSKNADGAATKPAETKPADKKGSALAEKRAAATEQKFADSIKRTFAKFDANRDGKLTDAEWTKAQPAISKLIEAEALKVPAAQREAVKQALSGMARPEVQRDGEQQVTPEAFEAYARQLAKSANETASSAGVADPAPTTVPPEGGKTRAQREREAARQRDRGELGPTASDRAAEQRRREEREREEAIRREALRRRGIPEGVRPGIRPEGIQPGGVRPEGVRPGGARPEGARPGVRPEGGARPSPGGKPR
jgi:hypothetical protein